MGYYILAALFTYIFKSLVSPRPQIFIFVRRFESKLQNFGSIRKLNKAMLWIGRVLQYI
jgi:hypothetical protein